MSKHIHSARLIWRDLQVGPKELHLDTLKCGQSFRWRYADDLWSCVLNGQLFTLKQTPSTVLYGTLPDQNDDEINMMKSTLKNYFQLDRGISLEQHYQRWSELDNNFKQKAPYFQGIRILRQDPWENLISFICSSNNNIARISKMVQNLCTHYGPLVITMDEIPYYDFPGVDQLAKPGVEDKLRQLGFGYRAKYIAQTAVKIQQKEKNWLMELRKKSYQEAKTELQTLNGVGPKVAECICLMSLDHPEAIPVDTHVWQIALRDYGFGKKGKTLTPKLYDQVGDHFRQLFGEYSGWAHSVLFTADLRSFKDRLSDIKKEEQVVEINHNDNKKRIKKRVKEEVVIKEEKVEEEKDDNNMKKRLREESLVVRRSTRLKKSLK
ncbi:hypothetical protein INT45_003462 [Circinella minor]|uniref:N-glycosylase/DNA lyase n=1 Tax=Circinella minor TaxID=1195481 RepID=A0A8H7S937_9FUNG|nr:hypothetical protein INT45_003462 [Circinella minor]